MTETRDNSEKPTSRHAVTERRKCYEMEQKNGWTLREYHRIDQFVDSSFPGASTHSRVGDWEVVRVEKYATQQPADFEAIVICYCRYSPVSTPLEPLPGIQLSQERQEVEA